MGSICGIVIKEVEENKISNQLKFMVKSLNHWNCQKIYQFSNHKVGLAGMRIIDPQAKDDDGFVEDQDNHLVVVADSCLTNRTVLISKLSLPGCMGNELPDAKLIKESWMKWGSGMVDYLEGEFVIVIYDKKEDKLFVCRDHLGTKPMFIYHSDKLFAFATEMKGILAIIGDRPKLNFDFVYNLLANVIADKELTIYDKIKKLKPAHYFVLGPFHDLFVKEYWRLNVRYDIFYKNNQDYFDRFDDVLRSAVKDRIPMDSNCGFELSGGLDSSTVFGVACNIKKNYKERFHTLSHVLKDKSFFPYTDEKVFINKVIQHLGIEKTHFLDTENGILDILRESVSIQDSPLQQRLHLFSGELYRSAESANIHHLFSGFGGDELVSSGPNRFFKLLADEKRYIRLLWEMYNWGKLEKKNFLKRYLKLIKHDLIFSRGINTNCDTKLDLINEPYAINPELYDIIYKHCNQKDKLIEENKELPDFIKLQLDRVSADHLSQRMEYCHIAALHCNITYHYPLLDKNLMELYFSFPTKIKFKNGYGRYLFRKSAEKYLPAEIAWRTEKMSNTIPGANKQLVKDVENIRNYLDYCDRNKIGAEFISISKMKKWLDLLIRRDKGNSKKGQRFGAFINYLSLLIFLEKHQ